LTDEIDPISVLPGDVVRELKDIAHRGSAGRVLQFVAEAVDAYGREAYGDALPPLLRAKEDAPRSATVRELLGLVFYKLGRWKDADRELAAYQRLSDRRDQDHLRADAERALGRPEKALEILQGLRPGDVDTEVYVEALVVAAGALADLGRHDEAVRFLTEQGPVRPTEVHPYHLRLWYALADALERAGRRPEAREWWDLVYAEEPEFFDVAQRRLGLGTR
jgi:tetratricopeptide (TPR) repeat protein